MTLATGPYSESWGIVNRTTYSQLTTIQRDLYMRLLAPETTLSEVGSQNVQENPKLGRNQICHEEVQLSMDLPGGVSGWYSWKWRVDTAVSLSD